MKAGMRPTSSAALSKARSRWSLRKARACGRFRFYSPPPLPASPLLALPDPVRVPALPMTWNVRDGRFLSIAIACGKSACRLRTRRLGVRSTTTGSGVFWFCSCSMFLSAVIDASNRRLAASCRSSPFSLPCQRIRWVLRMSQPSGNERARAYGMCSSSRIFVRMPAKRLSCQAKRLSSLLARDGGEVVQELGQGSFAVEVVEQRSHGNSSSAEHDRAAHDLGVPAERRRLVLDHCPDASS